MPSAACSGARVPRRCWGKGGRRGGGRGEAGRRAVTKGESRVWEVERKKVVRMEGGSKESGGGLAWIPPPRECGVEALCSGWGRGLLY